MKLQSLKIAALAFAGLAALAQSANATNVSTATGDLILGVYETNPTATGYGNTYEVDLGNLSNFSSTDVNYDLGSKVSITDLNNIFGSSLSSASWFVVGTNGTSGGSISGVPTLFADANFVTDTNTPGTYSHNSVASDATNIGGFQTGLSGQTATANSAYASVFSENAPANNYNGGTFGFNGSPALAVENNFANTSNFYLLNAANNGPSSTVKGLTYDLGNFQFVGGTDFVYNYQAEATPEPSTYALMGLGALALVIMARRRMASNL